MTEEELYEVIGRLEELTAPQLNILFDACFREQWARREGSYLEYKKEKEIEETSKG